MNLVASFIDLLQPLAPVMTAPSFTNLFTILAGWVFSCRRTVTGMIVASGMAGERHHSIFHRFFARAQWSLDDLGLGVFEIIKPWLDPEASVMLAIDDTLARKRGLKTFGVGMHHDPLISTRAMSLVNWGHDWVILGGAVLPLLGADHRRTVDIDVAGPEEATNEDTIALMERARAENAVVVAQITTFED